MSAEIPVKYYMRCDINNSTGVAKLCVEARYASDAINLLRIVYHQEIEKPPITSELRPCKDYMTARYNTLVSLGAMVSSVPVDFFLVIKI